MEGSVGVRVLSDTRCFAVLPVLLLTRYRVVLDHMDEESAIFGAVSG